MSTNFNDLIPSPPANSTNVKFQTDGSGNDSAYVPTPFLLETDVILVSLIAGDILVWDGSHWINAFPVFPANTPAVAGQALTAYDSTTGLFTQATVGGSFTKIAEVILASDLPTISFNSIPQTYRNLKIILTGRSDDTNVEVYAQFNGDTGTNYNSVGGFVGSASGSITAFGVAKADIGTVAPSGAPAGQADGNDITIYDYSRTVWNKVATTLTNRLDAATTGYVQTSALTWLNTATITDILLGKTVAGNFKTGTVATLYGVS